MKKTMKRLLSVALTLAMIASLMSSAFAASSFSYRQNVSSSKVTRNASAGSLPSSATVYAGNSYYFNVQVYNSTKLKQAKLYIQPVGGSSYNYVGTETASNYMRYAWRKASVGSKSGTLYYYWKLIDTSGNVVKTTKTAVKVNAASYTQSTVQITSNGQVVDTFNGVQAKYRTCSYNDNSNATYSCAAYVKRYYSAVYGVAVSNLLTGKTPAVSSGKIKKTTSPSVGDIGYCTNSGGGHWFIVKKVNSDGSVIAIEQNVKWKSGGKSYTYKNHKYVKSTSNLKFFTWSK